MRILYVTTDYPGFSECLFEGAEYPYGLPSFNKVILRLIEQGHEVNYVIIHNKNPLPNFNIKAKWYKESDIKLCLYTGSTRLSNLIFKFKLISSVRKLLKNEKYDFVYCHGTSGSLASLPAKWNNVPFGHRLYGTFMWEQMTTHGKFRAIFKNISEYFIFRSKKKFLLVTNDGSRGDLVYNDIWKDNTAPYKFYYWINGVDRISDIDEKSILHVKRELLDGPFIFCCARFDPWKRQDRVIRIIHELKKQGFIVNAYFAGPIKLYDNTTTYYEYICKLADELDVREQVVFLGNVDLKTITIMNKLAISSMILHDTCNMTNVFHESLSSGAVIIVKEDGVVNDFVENGKNGFLVSSNDVEKEAVEIIKSLIEKPEVVDRIRHEAVSTSIKKMRSWNKRVDDEIALIKEFANHK